MPRAAYKTPSNAPPHSHSHSFPLPHLAPPIPPRRSLKPVYSPWPAVDNSGAMQSVWDSWYAPYYARLHESSWNSGAGWDMRPVPDPSLSLVYVAPRADGLLLHRAENWEDKGIDPRLIYRSPSPDASFSSGSMSSDPELDMDTPPSSVLGSPSVSESSLLSDALIPAGSSSLEEEAYVDADVDAELRDRLRACLTTGSRPRDASHMEASGGKRKRGHGPTAVRSWVQTGPSEDGDESEQDDDDDDDDDDYDEQQEKTGSRKRPRLSEPPISNRPSRSTRRPRSINTRSSRPTTRRGAASRPTTRRPVTSPSKPRRIVKHTHEQTEVVFCCPYRLSSAPELTCGACFTMETDVRRHCATHIAKEYYQYLDSGRPAREWMFGGLEPTFIFCPNKWCQRPFVRKDALARHVSGSCLKITDRSEKAKRERLRQAKALTLRSKEHWVKTPVQMPREVEAVTAKVEGQQKRVITRIVRVVSTYEDGYDVHRVKDGDEMEVWWGREKGDGRFTIFQPPTESI